MRRLSFFLVAGMILTSGCKRSNDALMTGPGGGTTSVSMSIPQIDTTEDNIYRIFASVLDQVGNPITDLQIGNFSILEGGGPGVPIDVSLVNEPLYVVLVIDRSGSMFGARTTAANNAAVSLVNALGAGDYAALIEFDDEVVVTSGFTSDKSALIDLINAGVVDGGTAVYDATTQGADLLLGVHGRRLLLVLTDGEDISSGTSLQGVIDAVNDKGLSANMVALGATAGQASLQDIATNTSGIFAESSTGSDLSSIFLDVLRRFESLYAIRYRRHAEGTITAYVNYGDLTGSATKRLD